MTIKGWLPVGVGIVFPWLIGVGVLARWIARLFS